MRMKSSAPISEALILEKVVMPKKANLSPEAARSLLSLKFDGEALRLIRRLLQKNNRGTISAEERLLLDKYLHVWQVIDLIHAKARVSLKRSGN